MHKRGKENGEGGRERERTYGIKHWGRVRSISRIQYRSRTSCRWVLDDDHFPGVRLIKPQKLGVSGVLWLTSSQKELLPYHTILHGKYLAMQYPYIGLYVVVNHCLIQNMVDQSNDPSAEWTILVYSIDTVVIRHFGNEHEG
eukprot:3437856-Pleurochrysis_carterae.AAC.1